MWFNNNGRKSEDVLRFQKVMVTKVKLDRKAFFNSHHVYQGSIPISAM